MIVLNLVCQHEHHFEGWFASAEAFEQQRERSMLSCPICNSDEVTRLPSGPRIVSSARNSESDESVAEVAAQLREALKTLVRDSENVGRHFPEEARKIHYKEAPDRNIRGVASLRETQDLLEEGIVVLPLPPSGETH